MIDDYEAYIEASHVCMYVRSKYIHNPLRAWLSYNDISYNDT